MRRIFFVLGILVIIYIAYSVYQNGISYFLPALYGLAGGIFISYAKIIEQQQEIKSLRRKTEKASVTSEESIDKVKTLQAKVNTLEAALKNCLKE